MPLPRGRVFDLATWSGDDAGTRLRVARRGTDCVHHHRRLGRGRRGCRALSAGIGREREHGRRHNARRSAGARGRAGLGRGVRYHRSQPHRRRPEGRQGSEPGRAGGVGEAGTRGRAGPDRGAVSGPARRSARAQRQAADAGGPRGRDDDRHVPLLRPGHWMERAGTSRRRLRRRPGRDPRRRSRGGHRHCAGADGAGRADLRPDEPRRDRDGRTDRRHPGCGLPLADRSDGSLDRRRAVVHGRVAPRVVGGAAFGLRGAHRTPAAHGRAAARHRDRLCDLPAGRLSATAGGGRSPGAGGTGRRRRERSHHRDGGVDGRRRHGRPRGGRPALLPRLRPWSGSDRPAGSGGRLDSGARLSGGARPRRLLAVARGPRGIHRAASAGDAPTVRRAPSLRARALHRRHQTSGRLGRRRALRRRAARRRRTACATPRWASTW